VKIGAAFPQRTLLSTTQKLGEDPATALQLLEIPIQVALVLAVGLLAGYAASSAKFRPFQKADASPPERPAASEGPAPASCCTEGIDKPGAALAAHNSAVKEKSAESGKKPNILVLWGDDIGYWNLSAYNRGAMGYRIGQNREEIEGTTLRPGCSV